KQQQHSLLHDALPILTEKELNAIFSEINAGVPQLNAFLGSKNQGHLTNALNNFNSALSRVTRLPIPITKKGFDYSGDISNFQKTDRKSTRLNSSHVKI